MIPYGRQSISEEDIEAVVNVLRSDFLTQGEVVPQFESELCRYVGAAYGVAVNSGTSALHVACLALGLEKGDLLWTTPVTFVASANCGLYCGASVDFVDIDPASFNICTDALKTKLVHAEKVGVLPKVLVVVHLCGLSCDMAVIGELSKRYGFRVIEDASHAIGGRYDAERIGSCRYSDITTFSFHPVKTMTTGEGGMAITNDQKLYNSMVLSRSHGITRAPSEMTHEPDGPWYYQQITLGFNYRMTDIQAALGVSQLARLDSVLSRRHDIASRYDELLEGFPVHSQYRPEGSYSGMHLYVIRLQLNEIGISHRKAFDQLREGGVGVNVHYIPIHMQPWYKRMGFSQGDYPEAERYYNEAISLPMYSGLDEEQINHVVSVLRKTLAV